jgi:hypothetical protein
LILKDERRARRLPVWRVRTARAATGLAATVAVLAWMLTAGASYNIVSAFVHMKPTTTVTTARPEVGILVDAPPNDLPALATALASQGMRVSFTLEQAPTGADMSMFAYGDQAVPLLPKGGLVRWIHTRDQLRDVNASMGHRHHFLYASDGPSVGQWWLAHRAGGHLIAGAIRLDDGDDTVAHLHAGEVVELSVAHISTVLPLIAKLRARLEADHLQAVPVGRLLHDAGATV